MNRSNGGQQFTTKQLADALKSGVNSIREQLQVLVILDGTAGAWPGVHTALGDLEYIADVAATRTFDMENQTTELERRLENALSENQELKNAVANLTREKDALQLDFNDANKETNRINNQLQTANREASKHKQELWNLERQRAELAVENEKQKEANEFMEGEISSMKGTIGQQINYIASMKEDLAGRKADVQHLTRQLDECKAANLQQRRELEYLRRGLKDTQADLQAALTEKKHNEQEVERLQREEGRLGAELTKALKDVAKLKEWQDIMKRIEGEKLKEEQERRASAMQEQELKRNELNKRLEAMHGELKQRAEALKARDADMEQLKRQLAVANLQVKDGEKKIQAIVNERVVESRLLEECRKELQGLQQKLQDASIRIIEREKDKVVSESQLREVIAAEKAKMQAQLDEARREAAVQRKLAEGWSRDMKSVQANCKAAEDRAALLQKALDKTKRDVDASKLDTVKSQSAIDQHVRDLRSQLEAREQELKIVRLEYDSKVKAMEKLTERLQSENSTHMAEIARLRARERLPPIKNNSRPQSTNFRSPSSIQDQIARIRKNLASL